jgi:hypothetical protein
VRETHEHFIPDFSKGKVHDFYQKAVDRLTRDLPSVNSQAGYSRGWLLSGNGPELRN